MKFTSLTQRFAVWFAGVSLLPILIIGYSLLHTFEIEMQKTAIQQVSAIADMKAEQIDTRSPAGAHPRGAFRSAP